jgi:hypothetical protein
MSDFFKNLSGTFRALAPILLQGTAFSTKSVSTGAGDTYQPDLRQATEHNITCAGDLTLDNPIPFTPFSGFAPVLITHIRNASGGAITVTFGASYRQSAFTPPTDGNGIIMLWHFDGAAGLWYCSAKQTAPNA